MAVLGAAVAAAAALLSAQVVVHYMNHQAVGAVVAAFAVVTATDSYAEYVAGQAEVEENRPMI